MRGVQTPGDPERRTGTKEPAPSTSIPLCRCLSLQSRQLSEEENGAQDDHSHALNPHLASAVGGGGAEEEAGPTHRIFPICGMFQNG